MTAGATRGVRGGGSQAPLPLHAPVTATPRGQGSAYATGTGSNRGSTGEASGSRCPQRGFPAAGTAFSRCQPSLPPPLGSLPHRPRGWAAVGLLPGLCLALLSPPREGQEHRSPPAPFTPRLCIPALAGRHGPSSLQSPSCQGRGRGKRSPPLACLSPLPARRSRRGERRALAPQQSTFRGRRRKRRRIPSNRAQPWA